MKHLKPFKLFEEIDVDYKSIRKSKETTSKMVEAGKTIESKFSKLGIKLITKNVKSSDEKNKLWKEAFEKVKSNDKEAYGIMQWSDDTCQSISVISPAKGIEILQQPYYSGTKSYYYNEQPGEWCSLEIYNTPENCKSLYMMKDGEVLFDWNDYEKKSKGKLASKAQQWD